ncbi:hypothetical protein ABVK25_009279 [Lepraria finkii]|uniref:Uncharacterized protein n=1 Tax=Lepraria finkii TaxID=1340010 RepID=A0ABR4AYS0_9LECA
MPYVHHNLVEAIVRLHQRIIMKPRPIKKRAKLFFSPNAIFDRALSPESERDPGEQLQGLNAAHLRPHILGTPSQGYNSLAQQVQGYQSQGLDLAFPQPTPTGVQP